MKIKIFWANELEAGYKISGTIDLPIINQKIGFLHLEIQGWFFTKRYAWKIT